MSKFLAVAVASTGWPQYKLPADHVHQPRVCQLVARLCTDDGEVLQELANEILPDAWTVPEMMVAHHGWTTARLNDSPDAAPIGAALRVFVEMVQGGKPDVLVCYAPASTLKLIRGELRREQLPDLYGAAPDFDVMRAATEYCQLPPSEKMLAANRKGPKQASFQEACRHMGFGDFPEPRDAREEIGPLIQLYCALRGRTSVVPKVREPNA